MDLKIKNALFLVCGASSGFGLSVSEALLSEGAEVIGVSRSDGGLQELKSNFPDTFKHLTADLQEEETIGKVLDLIGATRLAGVFINAGGPPPLTFEETSLENWDESYLLVLRWKIAMVKALIPKFKQQNYGRILVLESVSAKQPVENLVLSNSFRLAMVGAMKTLSQEVASDGITINVLGPGYHDTNALKRLFTKRAKQENISEKEARKTFEAEVPVGRLGDPDELASLAVWLLSPVSGYVTGQTIDIDGGINRFVFG